MELIDDIIMPYQNHSAAQSVFRSLSDYMYCIQGRQSWEVGGRDPRPHFGQGVVAGREILLYLIMCKKYVRKW